MTQPDPLKLSLASDQARYMPGDTVTAVLLASTYVQPEDVELHDLEIKFAGIERVDTAWVTSQYRKEVPAINTDRRRVQRRVVHSHLHAATQGNFLESSTRRFLIKFSLPEWLPPSYRGIAVRYSYFLEAKASFTLLSVPQNADDLTLRLSIVVMPRSGKEEGDGRTRTPIPNLPDVPIKCWEVGSGTSLEDAVDHISKLSMNGGLGLPPTPFSLGRFQTDGSGPGPGPGSLSPADVTTTPNLAREKSFTSEKAVLSSHTSLTTSSLQRLSSSRETTFLEAESIQTATNVPDHAPNTLLGDFGFRTYALRLSDYPLVRIAIHPPPCGQLKPGGTFSGTLEFDNPENGIRCIQVTVLMNQDEVVNGEWRVSRGHQGSDGALCRVVDEFEESTVNTSCTNFVFSVPSDAVPTFHTDLIGVSWSLKFHFVALLTGSDKFSNKAGVERLTWTMPLTVVPPS